MFVLTWNLVSPHQGVQDSGAWREYRYFNSQGSLSPQKIYTEKWLAETLIPYANVTHDARRSGAWREGEGFPRMDSGQWTVVSGQSITETTQCDDLMTRWRR